MAGGLYSPSAGDVLTVANAIDYWSKQVVIICTSGTRPGSPREGMVIYETDTDAILFYDGSAWKRTAHHIPHSNSKRVVITGSRTITSTSYVVIPTDVVQVVSFVKHRADTQLIAEFAGTFVLAGGAANIAFGARINAVDYDIALFANPVVTDRHPLAGISAPITGVAAGTYTSELVAKTTANTLSFFSGDDVLMLKVTEVLA